jgi:hypothetical protein
LTVFLRERSVSLTISKINENRGCDWAKRYSVASEENDKSAKWKFTLDLKRAKWAEATLVAVPFLGDFCSWYAD